MQFQDRLATLTSVVNGSKSDLNSALTNLSQAVGEVQRFVHGTRDKVSRQVDGLRDVTQNLVDHKDDLEQVLHVAPSATANGYNMFDPRTGSASGVFVLNNFSDPKAFLCGMIGAVANVTAPTTSKLCAQTLGPALDQLSFNNLPFPVNPLLSSIPAPEQLIYSDPKLAPGGAGAQPAPLPQLTESAFDRPAATQPTTLPEMLLPAERPPS